MSNNTLANVSDDQFDEIVLRSPIPVVVDFWAPWCEPCKTLGTMLEKLAAKYEGSIKIVKMNVDAEKTKTSEYAIRGLPTLLLFKQGKVANQLIGVPGEEEIEKAIQALL